MRRLRRRIVICWAFIGAPVPVLAAANTTAEVTFAVVVLYGLGAVAGSWWADAA